MLENKRFITMTLASQGYFLLDKVIKDNFSKIIVTKNIVFLSICLTLSVSQALATRIQFDKIYDIKSNSN